LKEQLRVKIKENIDQKKEIHKLKFDNEEKDKKIKELQIRLDTLRKNGSAKKSNKDLEALLNN